MRVLLRGIERCEKARSCPVLGADVYLVDMELYTQFVSYRLIRDMLGNERERVTPVEDAESR